MSQVKKVRQSIAQRKRKRGMDFKEGNRPQEMGKVLPMIPQDDEKHGFFPIADHAEEGKLPEDAERKKKAVSSLFVKAVLSAALFFIALIIMQGEADKPKRWVSDALTENFPFAKANAWYLDRFGSPLALLPENTDEQKTATVGKEAAALPVAGNVKETFQANGEGVKIAPGTEAKVNAMKEGIVIFAGKDKKTNRTIVIQHADGSKATYGHLSKTDVHLYQYVKENQPIATFTPTEKNEVVYFSIEKDKKFIDPITVNKVDDRS